MKYREEIKDDIIFRGKSAYGHLHKVLEMMENDECLCMDILNQLSAVQKALSKVEEIILENHLKDCVLRKRHGKCAKEIADEVIEAYKRRG